MILIYILTITLLLYLTFALITRFTLPYFRREKFDLYEFTVTLLLQPVMYIFGHNKVTHWYDWEFIDDWKTGKVPVEKLLRITNNKKDFGKPDKNLNSRNALRSLGGVKEGAIVKPIDFEGEWALAFRLKPTKFQKLKLYTKGPVRVIADGLFDCFGITPENRVIQLELVKYIDRSEHREILHV